MHIFYIDDAGCTGILPSATSEIQPVFCLSGIILRQADLDAFTREFLELKKRFFPGLSPATGESLDWIKVEIKGSDLRRQIRDGNRDQRRHTLGFMDKGLELCEKYHAKTLGRIYIKGIGAPFDGTAIYSSAVQLLAKDFQNFLVEQHSSGLMILDSRNKPKNANVSHSVFTQKFKASGDAYNRLLEMPLFVHSDNQAGIQVADLLCSGFLFPMATYTYCLGFVNSVHVSMKYHKIRELFGVRLKRIQYRYQITDLFNNNMKWKGGIVTSDGLHQQYGSLLFEPANH